MNRRKILLGGLAATAAAVVPNLSWGGPHWKGHRATYPELEQTSTRADVINNFMASTDPFQIIRGPIGSGKTTTLLKKLLFLMERQTPDAKGIRRTRVVAMSDTYPKLTSMTIPTFKQVASQSFPDGVVVEWPYYEPYITVTIKYWLFDGTKVEAEVLFLSEDRCNDIKRIMYIPDVTFFWMNDFVSFNNPGKIALAGVFTAKPYRHGQTTHLFADSYSYHVAEERTPIKPTVFKMPSAVAKTQASDPVAVKSLTGGYWRDKGLYPYPPKDFFSRLIEGNTDDFIRDFLT